MKKRYYIPLAVLAVLWAWNSSLLASAPENSEIKLLSHRGVHQTYPRDGLKRDTCTATRIYEPTHNFLENTIASSQAAFDFGADVVEIDIHLTTDRKFAVFHDWTLGCRTNGKGVTRKHDIAHLQSLDLGYGYTADSGKSFPFRGKFVGELPELEDFISKFPGKEFLFNFKSNDRYEGEALFELATEKPVIAKAMFGVYGGRAPTNFMLKNTSNLMGYTKPQTKSCLVEYLSYGWTGIVPEMCRNRLVAVPANYAWMLWGWPNRFQARMEDVGSKIILLGPMSLADPGSAGLDTIEQISLIPAQFDGYIWTNRIELIGPYVKNALN